MVEMSKEWVDWIDANNGVQVEWALQYLTETAGIKLAVGIEHFPSFYALESAAQAIAQQPDIGSSWKALERMKNAWRKQKQRLKAQSQGKKQVTLSISATALRQLNRLVSQSEAKTSASKMVEELITKEASVRKAQSEAEKQEHQKNEIGQLVYQRVGGQAPKTLQPAYTPTVPNNPITGRYADVEPDFDNPQKSGMSESTSIQSPAQAQKIISQPRSAIHNSTTVLANMGADEATDSIHIGSVSEPSRTAQRSENGTERDENYRGDGEHPDASKPDKPKSQTISQEEMPARTLDDFAGLTVDQVVAATPASVDSHSDSEPLEQNSGEYTFYLNGEQHSVPKDAAVTVLPGNVKGDAGY